MKSKIDRIIFISRPTTSPKNEAGVNFVRSIAESVENFRVYLLSNNKYKKGKVNYLKVYRSKDHSINIFDKIRLVIFLLSSKKYNTIFHSVFVPTLLNSLILRFSLFGNEKRVIQTVQSSHYLIQCTSRRQRKKWNKVQKDISNS